MALRAWLATTFGRTIAAASAGGAMIAAGALISTFSTAHSDAAIEQHRALVIANQARGDFSQAGLSAILGRMDPADAALAARYDPALVRPMSAVTPPAALNADLLRLLPQLNAAQAQAVNTGLPLSLDPNPAARPFWLKSASAQDRDRALGCLTQAIYYEAGFEPVRGAQAVAQVVLNRVRHPAFPKTICGVVYEGASLRTGCQFSFTCDGFLARPPAPAAWKRAQDVAQHALNGFVLADIGGATHYHTQWVMPYWAPSLAKVDQIGAHIFYRWAGDWGLPAAFHGRYAGGEIPGADVGGDPLAAYAPPTPANHGRVGAVLHMEAAADPPAVVLAPAPAPLTTAPALSTPVVEDGPAFTLQTEGAQSRGRAAFSDLH
jgi:hypothetical protein